MRPLFCTFLTVMLCAFAFASPSSAQDNSQQGRFVIAFGPLVRADTFLLDTITGAVE
jgi:hypothetical protein